MIPAVHHSCNHVLGPAKGDEGKVGTLPIYIHPAGVACFFLPTTSELAALNRGEPLCVSLSIDLRTQGFAPIAVGVPEEMFDLPAPAPAPAGLQLADFAALLARHGIIDPRACEDPEGYDGHDTAIRLGRALRELTTPTA